MKFQNFEAHLITDDNPYSLIEFAGRLCYKSQSKGDPRAMFKMLSERGHYSVMEHATFVYDVSGLPLPMIRVYEQQKYFNVTKTITDNEHKPFRILLSFNLRALIEAYTQECRKRINATGMSQNILALGYILAAVVDEFGQDIYYDSDKLFPNFMRYYADDVGKGVAPVRLRDFPHLPPDFSEIELLKHLYLHFHVVCDRGVANEFVRHRCASYSQESTRYCNYAKDRFNTSITIATPSWWNDISESAQKRFLHAWSVAEEEYIALVKDHHFPPQHARAVLPLGLKTEMVVTMNGENLNHFFDLRKRGTTGSPHPDMAHLATLMHRLVNKRLNIEL